ncbi:YdaU family protein [Acinetobacter towneri]|uniref:YdaU family protein n=1 Tax=Acinetobacter towneri TaxID=202956 RepID=UPI00293650D0|nr:YdaU family protein [Acinetobacter towneri]MDV2454028.1 YdaU family protein [Acinetobacter towneri]
MHYYKRNIGDYAKKAGRLSMLEHGAYTLLMDAIYDRETFPTLEEALDWAWARDEAEVAAVKFVLNKFFELREDGRYVQNRIQEELDSYKSKAETNARIAKEREEKRKYKHEASRTVHEACEEIHEPSPNHKPLTNNQEPLTNINITADESAKNQKPKRITKKQKAINALIEMGVGEKYAQAVIEKRKGSEFTELAIDEIKLQAEAVNLNFVQAIEFAAKQEWGSFRADWYQNRMAKQQQAYHPQSQANPWAEYNQRVGEQFSQNEMVDVTPKKSVLIEEVGHA